MNGFSSRVGLSHRQLLACAVAGWLGVCGSMPLLAQESEAPPAPPAIPSEELPSVKSPKPASGRTVKPYTRSSKTRQLSKKQVAATKLIPTSPEGQSAAGPLDSAGQFREKTQLIPTEIQASTKIVKDPEPPTAVESIDVPSADASAPAIQQVQAETTDGVPLVPGDGLEVPALEAPQSEGQLSVPEIPSEEPAVPLTPGETVSEVPVEQVPAAEAVPAREDKPALEFANPAPAREMPVAPAEPATPAEEIESEPAPLDDRAENSQPVPTQFNIKPTAAAESYNEPAVGGFNPQDPVHTVGKGESFWSIAKKHYRMGRYSAALAEYNKSRIPKPDLIRPGMKVIVPPVETLEQKYGHLISGYVSPASAAEAVAAKPGFFVDSEGHPFYRVGEGDTLSDIARNHLGRSSRWVQIVGLNKERLPNPDAMKPGMVLRLPDDASEMISVK